MNFFPQNYVLDYLCFTVKANFFKCFLKYYYLGIINLFGFLKISVHEYNNYSEYNKCGKYVRLGEASQEQK